MKKLLAKFYVPRTNGVLCPFPFLFSFFHQTFTAEDRRQYTNFIQTNKQKINRQWQTIHLEKKIALSNHVENTYPRNAFTIFGSSQQICTFSSIDCVSTS